MRNIPLPRATSSWDASRVERMDQSCTITDANRFFYPSLDFFKWTETTSLDQIVKVTENLKYVPLRDGKWPIY